MSTRGHHYGAFDSDDKFAKRGYDIFISTTDGIEDTCECMAFVHGNPCYHLIKAKEMEIELFAWSDSNQQAETKKTR